jgi:hypothetical protein
MAARLPEPFHQRSGHAQVKKILLDFLRNTSYGSTCVYCNVLFCKKIFQAVVGRFDEFHQAEVTSVDLQFVDMILILGQGTSESLSHAEHAFSFSKYMTQPRRVK